MIKRRWFQEPDGFPTILGFFLAVAVAITVFLIAILSLIYVLERKTCGAQLDAMQREGGYGIWTGCMVELNDGTRINIKNYRATQIEKGK